MSGHGPLTWMLLGAVLALLFLGPLYYRLGLREGKARAAAAWKARR